MGLPKIIDTLRGRESSYRSSYHVEQLSERPGHDPKQSASGHHSASTWSNSAYRVYDFFVEIIPRQHRLTFLLNLAFEDCNDPSGKARNATEGAFVINAAESGGVLYTVKSAKGAARTAIRIRNCFAPRSVLREFLRRRRRNPSSDHRKTSIRKASPNNAFRKTANNREFPDRRCLSSVAPLNTLCHLGLFCILPGMNIAGILRPP
jgi:hypothetical protein